MQKTLRKVLDELNSEHPRLDYIRGMLEVLVEDEKVSPPVVLQTVRRDVITGKPSIISSDNLDDEAKTLEAYGKAMLGKVDQSAITTEN